MNSNEVQSLLLSLSWLLLSSTLPSLSGDVAPLFRFFESGNFDAVASRSAILRRIGSAKAGRPLTLAMTIPGPHTFTVTIPDDPLTHHHHYDYPWTPCPHCDDYRTPDLSMTIPRPHAFTVTIHGPLTHTVMIPSPLM